MLNGLTVEDKKCIHGILLDYARNEKKQYSSMKKIYIIISVVGIVANFNLLKNMVGDFFAGEDFLKLLLWIILILFFLLIMIMGISNLYIELKERPAEQLMNNVINNEYKINKVFIVEADNGYGEGWSTEYYAVISDLNGNLYEGTYSFFFKGDYEIGTAFYFEILICNNKKKGLVIPGRDESPETWNYGLKMYNKYMK